MGSCEIFMFSADVLLCCRGDYWGDESSAVVRNTVNSECVRNRSKVSEWRGIVSVVFVFCLTARNFEKGLPKIQKFK